MDKVIRNTKKNNTLEQQNIVRMFPRTPCGRVQGETLIKSLVRKLERYLDKPFKLRNIYWKKRIKS